MKPIPILRAAHLLPYIEFLKSQGAAVERELRKAKLPVLLAENPDSYIPRLQAESFSENISLQEGIDELGLRAARYQSAEAFTRQLFSRLTCAPTLKKALKSFAHFIKLEDCSLSSWIAQHDAITARVFTDDSQKMTSIGHRNAEWTQLVAILELIRLFAGKDWSPVRIGLGANIALNQFAFEQFPDSELHIAQNYSWIELPLYMLALPAVIKTRNAPSPQGNKTDATGDITMPLSMVHLIKSYIGEEIINVNMLAEICGLSLRTLQRGLMANGTSYSELLEQARIKMGMELLAKRDIKIIDIAYSVGYSDPSHFTRAFRRCTGVTPKSYRESQSMGNTQS